MLPGELGNTELEAAGENDVGMGDTDLPAAGGADAEFTAAPSKLPEDKLFVVLRDWWNADAEHSSVWRNQAREDYDFRSGEQWGWEDKALLNSQMRPHIVFNRVLTILKAVAGMEINGRHEIAFLPRNNSDTAVNELLTAASKWMGDECDAEDEESSSFEDTATCGMGWCENRLDFVEEWNGKYIEEQVDPLEMFWDRTARKKNLSDARRMARVRTMPLADAMQLFPKFNSGQLDATWANDGPIGATKSLEQKRYREENTSETNNYDDKAQVTIVHIQWWELEYYWKVANPQDGSLLDLDDEKHELLQKRLAAMGYGGQVKSVRLPKKVFKHAFLGSVLLKAEDSPVKDQFTWKCITGELDHNKGTWFGLIKVMRDPQMWANKWLSQTLHIINSTAKGGIMAEEDAFAGDQKEAEQNYARPDAITWVNKGAIKEGKIMAKPGQGLPEGIASLMQYAVTAIRDVTGINLELLGQQDQNQPGILEAYRKQAGMTILATLFDALRRFRKQTGRVRLYYIQNYMADGRLIRVVGPQGAQSLPLLKDKCLGEYSVVVDDTPTSPNMKEANWLVIQPMIAMFKEQLTANPEVLTALLEYSPLPSPIVEMLKKFAAQQKQDPDAKAMKDLQKALIVSNINKNQGAAEKSYSDAGSSEATAMYDVAMAKNLLAKGDMEGFTQHIQALETASKIRKTNADIQQQGLDARQKHLDAAHTVAEIDHTRAKTAGEHAAAHATLLDAHTNARESVAEHGGLQPQIGHFSADRVRGHGEIAPRGSNLPVPHGLPPGTRRAKDGRLYSPDPGRRGKYLEVIPHQQVA